MISTDRLAGLIPVQKSLEFFLSRIPYWTPVKTEPSVDKPVRPLIIHDRALADLSSGWKEPPTSGF
jgi:hypothetical protein